jgi:phosphatidylserine decarboxylase
LITALYVLAALVVLWCGWLVFLRKVWFYRDPIRTPERTDAITSPADGRVIYIRKFSGGSVYAEKLGEQIPLPEITCAEGPAQEGWIMGIYMSPLDVHFNFAPMPGEVQRIVRSDARLNYPMLDLWEYIRVVYLRKMVDMFARKYHLENERNTIFLRGEKVSLGIVLIADKFVNKIRCFVSEQEKLAQGQKLAFIERGSQVDLVFYAQNVKFLVEPGQQVYGGKTAIAELSDPTG